jgi:hypothetical protein
MRRGDNAEGSVDRTLHEGGPFLGIELGFSGHFVLSLARSAVDRRMRGKHPPWPDGLSTTSREFHHDSSRERRGIPAQRTGDPDQPNSNRQLVRML